MGSSESDRSHGQHKDDAAPGIHAARAQVAAARLRCEALMASGRLPGPSTDDPASPRKKSLPNYKLERELHRGGQGVVYLALQESTDRKVAVKVFRQGTLGSLAELARFEREVEVLSRLKHPNVVTIHDCGRSEDDVYLVMDYVAGHSLDAHMAHEQPSQRDAIALFAKICDGVNAAHLRGVIHRDLKPSNIRIDNDGQPRILDFGLAKLERDAEGASSAEGMTITGQFVGSLPWASPEQAEGRSDTLDIRTDVYSLGVIFYQLLTGKFPYPIGGRMDDVVRHIVTTNPTRPSTIDKTIGNEVETILLKCLAKEPERRYQSAGDLARDLRHYLEGEPIEAKRDSIRYVVRKQLRRHRVAVSVVIGFAILLAGGLVASLTQWYRAEQALLEKEVQRKLADQRADETQRVADFQSKMLSEIDVEAMARGIKENFRGQVRTALERQFIGEFPDRRKRTLAEVEAELAEFDQRASPAQAVDVARRVMDEFVLARAAQSLESQFPDQPLVQARIWLAIGQTYYVLGLYDQAEPYYRRALDIHRRLLGDGHPRTVESMSGLGVLIQQNGKLAEAEPYLREALTTRRNTLGDEHPDTLASLNNMAFILQMRGHFAAAEPMYRKALEVRRRTLGNEDRATLNSMSNLASALRGLGKLAEAELLGREAVNTSRRVFGEKSLDYALALSKFGGILQDVERYADAEPILREALALRREINGDQHPDVAVCLNNLGSVLSDIGNLTDAEPLIREALAMRRKLFGDEHQMVVVSLDTLALLLKDKGDYVEAEAAFREALALAHTLVGHEHPVVAQLTARLGWVLHKKGDDEQAELLLREALAQRRKLEGDRDTGVGNVLNDLGWVLADRERCAEAEPLLREAISIVEKQYPVGHGNTEKPRIRLAECLTLRGEYEEAEGLLNKSEAAIARNVHAEPGLVQYSIQAQIKLYDAWHAAEPDRGSEAKAAHHRTKLAEMKALHTEETP